MGTTLIVTEKPDAALHVAEALSQTSPLKRINVDGVPFFEVRNDAERLLVCSALGHLYVVASKEARGQSGYPVWEYEWKPKYQVERGQQRQKKWVYAINKVARQADRFIDACDFDVEGSLIGYTVLKYACEGADEKARRMKFSTLTEAELRSSYLHALPHLDFDLISAGMCRHEVDWLYGINLSRALTQSAYRHSGRYATLSTGRVQGPTLRYVVERETEIETFIPIPSWTLKVEVKIGNYTHPADYETDRFNKRVDAENIVKSCTKRTGLIEKLEYNTYDLPPPTPFDLSSLQNEAYRHFQLSPRASLIIAERLYLDQLISYPRTSSQKLPPSIGYERIVKSLGQMENYREATNQLLKFPRLAPNEGRKDDPAHPAVYPTGVIPKRRLENKAQKLFDLVVRRFLASFGTKAVKRSDKATIKVDDYRFFLRGSRLIEKGWTALYGPYAKFENITLPPLTTGQQVLIHDIESEAKFTQPPPRYNPSSLLRKMEESEIGTKATRADIIETLHRRGYVTGQRMAATPLAFRVIEILTKHCSKIVDVTFTRELEAKMEDIGVGSERRERVISDAIGYLKPIIETFKLREQEIGAELAEIISEMREESTTLTVPCPNCNSVLKIVRNPRTRKRFVGCTGKWKNHCSYSLPLPQLGSIALLQKLCPTCGFQLIQVTLRGRRPLITCSRCYAAKAGASAAAQKPTAVVRPQWPSR